MPQSPLTIILLLSGYTGLLAAAATDIKDRTIPNPLVVAVIGVGLALRLASEPASLWLSLVAACLVFVVLAILAHQNFIGGGDAKLIAAVTLLVPPYQVMQLLLDIALAGGVLSCFYLAVLFIQKRRTHVSYQDPSARNSLAQILRKERNRMAAGEPMPYALAILGGLSFLLLFPAQ